MHNELNCAILAARQAGALLKDNFGAPIPVIHKGEIDLVTELDRQAERQIANFLIAEFPGYDILGEEEHHAEDAGVPRWIVDPLDGTTNYSHTYPLFAVSIALEIEQQVELGVVYNPLSDELFSAVRGEGAFLNERPIRVSNEDTLGRSLIASGFPYDAWTSERDNVTEWGQFVKKVLSPRCDGCASLDLCHVANGRLDGYWELDLEPWDMAAGGLIAAEAGARISGTRGEEYNPHRRSVLAANPKLHAQMLLVLNAE